MRLIGFLFRFLGWLLGFLIGIIAFLLHQFGVGLLNGFIDTEKKLEENMRKKYTNRV